MFAHIYLSAKTFKLTQYPVIPPWAQLHEKDAFEYKLRSKAELLEEEKKCPPNFPIKLIYVDYPQARFETTDKARKVFVNKEFMLKFSDET